MSEEIPQKTALDRARTIGIGVLGAVPYVGPVIAAIGEEIIPSPMKNRRDKFYQTIIKGIEILKLRVDNLDEIINSEDMQSLYVRVAESVRRDARSEKLRALSSAIGNTADERWELHFQEGMLSLLDRLTVTHLLILREIALQGPNPEDYSAGDTVRKVALNYFNGDQERAKMFLDDLGYRNGLVDWREPGSSIPRDKIRLTQIGKEFCDYLEIGPDQAP